VKRSPKSPTCRSSTPSRARRRSSGGATSLTPSPGPTLIDAVTYFSWLLQVGATSILPVYATVGVACAVFAARTAEAVDRYLAPLAVVVTAAAEVTGCYGQHGIVRLGAVRDAVRDNPARLLDLGD
jgi:hypothetical protein